MRINHFQGLWDAAVSEHPSSSFLVFRSSDGAISEWSYQQFDEVVARTAAQLRSSGVARNQAVHVCLKNSPAFVALWLAVSRLGAWFVPVDPGSAAKDIADQVRRVEPVVGVCAASRTNAYRSGASDAVSRVIEVTELASDVEEGGALYSDTVVSDAVEVDPHDRLSVMFTSGTTAAPKGVVLTQSNYANVAYSMAEAAELEARHRWYVTLPMFHANAQYYCFAPAIAIGASVALTAEFSSSNWIDHARSLKVTHASLFAAPIRMILARSGSETSPLALEHVWFAQSLGAEHYAQFSRLVGTRPRQLYGMTETVSIVCADSTKPYRHDVIGSVRPDRQVRFVDPDTRNRAQVGDPAELVVLGKRGDDLFEGYLDDETKNSEVFSCDSSGHWFHTGDLVNIDKAGNLRFVGRIDDVIKVAGENVSLTEVEATLAQAPGVLEAAVVARPDPIRDVVPVAYVVPSDAGRPPTPLELEEWARVSLSPACRPREWHVIDELPRTSVGKVRRFKVTS